MQKNFVDDRLVWAALSAIGVGLWLSGGLWLLLQWDPVRAGALGIRRHPLEPWTLAVHDALAVGGTWLLGLPWKVHIPDGWSTRRQRRSGVLFLVLAVWLIASGYLLYCLGDEQVRSVISLPHWGAGAARPFAFAVHRPGAPRGPATWTRRTACDPGTHFVGTGAIVGEDDLTPSLESHMRPNVLPTWSGWSAR